MLNATEIKSYLPITFLKKFEGNQPTKTTRPISIKNVGSVLIYLGGGNGLIGIVMRPELYLIMTGSKLNLPQDPGYSPVIPDGATTATTQKTCATVKP